MLTATEPKRRQLWLRILAGVVAVVLLVVGLWFGGHPTWLPSPLRSVFVSQTQEQKQFQQVVDLISNDYYRKVDTEKLVNKGLVGMVASLGDPYSHYYPPALYQSFQQITNPQVTGIGVEIAPQEFHGGLAIEEVFDDSPAARGGLAQGDVILAVNGRLLSGLGVDAASSLIRGKEGTPVTLRVRRGDHVRTVTLTRANVVVPVAASKILRYHGIKLGYLEFSQFAENSADELRAQVRLMLRKGAQGLILDLRDNPGGLVSQADGVASIFIRNGTIVTTRGRSVPTEVYMAQGDAIAPAIPLVVLVDRGTASSAEIVTAALQDHKRAEVVGTHTYGKGVFQQITPITGGGALDMTVGEFFTPNGRNLGGGGVKRGAGVTPNIYVYDNPNSPGSRALRVAERVVAGEVK